MNTHLVKFKSCLGDCKVLEKCECKIKTSYETIKKDYFYIQDDRKLKLNPCQLIKNVNESSSLFVDNSLNKGKICFVKIDKCLLPHYRQYTKKKCECVLFDKKSIFFIEISETKKSNRKKKRARALEQLYKTITHFKEADIDLNAFSKKMALLCFLPEQPKEEVKYITNASSNTKRVLFDDIGFELIEGNKAVFA